MVNIEMRTRQLVNTDPQRRCYNGCHFSSELVWGQWSTIDFDIRENKIKARLLFWKELNDGAIKARGKGAESEFREVTK